MPETYALAAEEVMPDLGPGMEWYRELADQDAVPRPATGHKVACGE